VADEQQQDAIRARDVLRNSSTVRRMTGSVGGLAARPETASLRRATWFDGMRRALGLVNWSRSVCTLGDLPGMP